VEDVRGPHRPFGQGSPVGPSEVLASLPLEGAGPEPPDGAAVPGNGDAAAMLAEAAMRFVSLDGDTARLEVTLTQPPYSDAALASIPDLRQVANQVALDLGIGQDAILIGGTTAESYDIREANQRDTFLVLPLILLAIAIILALLLRSLVAPLYLAATIVFTYFSTLGISLLAFEFVFGHEGISPYVPFYLFVFLNALGVDYNIYLVSRLREEASRQGDIRLATKSALAQTGGVITSAGLILAGTFSALMTLAFVDLFQLGFAVAIGVLMDTFITRTLIVPSLVTILGRWNWWPGKGASASP
jgi:putative drug exporter of the RND superfamily